MLIELALKATVLVAAAGAAALLLRRSSASIRHLVWLSALTTLLLLPLAALLSPAWTPQVPQAAAITDAARTAITVTASAPAKSFPWGLALISAWGAVALLLLLRALAAQVSAARLIARAELFRPGVSVSPETDVPLVAGLRRPIILLPSDAPDWSAERLDLVIRHESGHCERLDPLWQFIAHLCCALYWPLPWVWMASRKLRTEAELACDDGVLLSGQRASCYAGHLIDIVRGLSGRERIPQGGIPMARLNQLELRLRSLLAHNINRNAATRRACLAAAAAAVLFLIPVSALHLPSLAVDDGVHGSVKDASGATVPKARVTVQFTNSSRREVAYTDEIGQFSLAPLPDGIYDVTVAKPGFALLMLKGIAVEKGASQPLVLVLQTGKITESLTVTAAAPAPPPPPPAPPTAGEPKRIKVGGNVQAVKLVKQVRPSYPPECKAAGVQGLVMLRAVISKEGNILNLEQVNELVDRRLVEAAMEAVKQWQYQPTLLNGVPVEILTEIDVNFTLSQ